MNQYAFLSVSVCRLRLRARTTVLLGLALASLDLPRMSATDHFASTDWQIVAATNNPSGHPMQLTYQGPPPATDAAAYDGSPCNVASVADSAAMAGSLWTGSGSKFFMWANRYNTTPPSPPAAQPNTRSNPIEGTPRRSVPLPWVAARTYAVDELVYINYDAGSDWWRCTTTHTSGGSFDPSKWTEEDSSCISAGMIVPQECRFEYSSYAKAIASNLVIAKWLAGQPDYADDGTGYLDTATNAGVGVYTQSYLMSNLDTLFTGRPVDMGASGSNDYAVMTDNVMITGSRLKDAWIDFVPGTAYTAGQLVRDQGNLLANDFSNYGASVYTDSATGNTPSNTTKTISGGYCVLAGINVAVRHKVLVPATSGKVYELRVTGVATQPTTEPRCKIRLQVFGLDSSGNETATHVETAFTINSLNKEFTYTQKFGVSASGDIKAWPAGATNLRFSVNANSGMTAPGGGPAPSISISSMCVREAGVKPTYWRVLSSHRAPSSTSTTFATFAGDRAANPTVFDQHELGVELDYEVADLRPSTGVATAFGDLRAALNEEGYTLSVYTNSLDDYLDLNGGTSGAAKNGLINANLDAVLGACDLLTAVIPGMNYRGSGAKGLMAITYDRFKYDQSTSPKTQRTNFSPAKIGFAFEMPDPGALTSCAIVGASGPDVNGRVTFNTPSGSANGATTNMYVKIMGLNGTLGANFNGYTYHVASGGSTSFKVDTRVTSINSDGSVNTTSLPTFATYSGGGMVLTGGLSVADFQAARDDYFTALDVTHFELWRNRAIQLRTAPPAPVNVIKVTVSGTNVIIDTDASVENYTRGRVYLDNLPSPYTQLNGCSYTVDDGLPTSCPPGAPSPYSGTHFLLVGYRGDNLTTSGTLSAGTAAEALSLHINEKVAALSGL